MKTAGQIRQKLKQVVYRHRKEHVRRGLARRPENCEHNGVVHLPVHMANRETVRICRYVDDNGAWRNRVCDPALGGVQQAQACPHFSCCNTPESLKEDFGRGIGLDGTPVEIGHIAKHYPDVAALMWVLGPVAGPQAPEDDPIDDGILAFFGPSESLEDEETDE